VRIIGLGTHIVECLRIAQLIERHGEVFIQRVFTLEEINYCSGRKAATQHYAGHWAAKEATLKALGTNWTRGIAWRDIEVRCDRDNCATVELFGEIRELANRLNVNQWKVSISQCRTHATATVIAIDEKQ
jgi:holo-[acyl-carrier protein] synthase